MKKKITTLFVLAALLLPMFISTPSVFAADPVTIYDIQYTADPSGDSPFAGQTVTTQGIVTASYYGG
ncbi:hypothetical protein KA005_29945, partial [bacterium]|nr:hypothetical protein [bacterium]